MLLPTLPSSVSVTAAIRPLRPSLLLRFTTPVPFSASSPGLRSSFLSTVSRASRTSRTSPSIPLRRHASGKAHSSTTTTSSPASSPPSASTPAQNSGSTPPNPPIPQPFFVGAFSRVNNVIQAYGRVQARHPWRTQLVASCTVYLMGDLLAQFIEYKYSAEEAQEGEDGKGKDKWGYVSAYDGHRTLRHLTVGAIFAVPGYQWFMWLGQHFNYASSPLLSLATKVVVNQLVFTPVFNTYFFAMQSLLAGATVQEAFDRVRNTLPRSFINSLKLWPAVTAFSFWYIQPQFRFVFVGAFAVVWQSYLSWLNQRAAQKERELAAVGAAAPAT